jgi:SAM-dependent methyltransferase
MAHKQQMDYVKNLSKTKNEHFNNKSVLEIGSLNVNGSIREFFKNCNYIGVDIASGKDVDVVAKGHEFKYQEQFDVVCSCECFEHDEHYKETIINMFNHLKHGGLFFFTCAGEGRPEHGTTRTTPNSIWGTSNDYYKNLNEKDIKEVLSMDSFSDYKFFYEPNHKDLYFYGVKK